MGLLRWLTSNVANTTDPTHDDLDPLRRPGNVADWVAHLQRVVALRPRWKIVTLDPQMGTAHLTRTTRLFRFVDNVHLTCSEEGAGLRIDAESKSRIGAGDFGQNRRNILELWK
ncbi:MAG: DUF1499 domain-containing protein, partial [Gemmataceae bacterium]